VPSTTSQTVISSARFNPSLAAQHHGRLPAVGGCLGRGPPRPRRRAAGRASIRS
jgi:hypothetical protein